jgi:deoxyribose-phosphate aldolase
VERTLAALRIARNEGVTTVFNPAPARSELPEELYRLSDVFCPNESETEILTGRSVKTLEDAEAAARVLLRRGAGAVILTLGERGSLLVTADRAVHVPVEPVRTIDTTGAGDCFVGSLAYFLATGTPMEDAIRRSNRIASISVQSPGTQTSFPRAADLPPDLLDRVGAAAIPSTDEAPPMTAAELARRIDHTLLKPDARSADFDRLCEEAVRHGFGAVCVNSGRVARVARRLRGTGISVCAVIGFPLGAMSTAAKVFEARQAVADGARELDMVIDIGALKSGEHGAVEDDVRAVRDAAPRPIVLKVILETCLLTDDEKRAACAIAGAAGADFVKTSTGFAGGGATVGDVALMRAAVGPEMGVKASGGIKDARAALALIAAGADRIGAGAGVEIVGGLGR